MNRSSKNSRKVRVSFRKNRGKREREGDFTRQAPEELEDLTTGERLSGKGNLSRHRTVVTAEGAGDEVVREIDEDQCLPGRVLIAIGANHCSVQDAQGVLHRCVIRRVLRTMSRDGRNAVVAGDRVWFLPTSAGEGVIERVETRHGTVSRGSRRAEHMLVANIDQAVIVASVAEPEFKPGLIDRFLCSVEKGGIRGIICINKMDLGDPAKLQPIVGQYARLGYPVVLTDTRAGMGIAELRELLAGRETVFTGQSGVGKSSLLNAVQPGLARATGSTSEDSGKGRHTTRVTELIPLAGGGWVVDTPGIRQLELWNVPRDEVEGHFIEFRPYVADCRFANCTHLHETECGVKDAVRRGLISSQRHASYARIFRGDTE